MMQLNKVLSYGLCARYPLIFETSLCSDVQQIALRNEEGHRMQGHIKYSLISSASEATAFHSGISFLMQVPWLWLMSDLCTTQFLSAAWHLWVGVIFTFL